MQHHTAGMPTLGLLVYCLKDWRVCEENIALSPYWGQNHQADLRGTEVAERADLGSRQLCTSLTLYLGQGTDCKT